jgi:OmpA-OmpF porin, OOP family
MKRHLLSLSAASFIAGCATPMERVVLLPNADGHASAVTIEAAGAVTVVDQPYGQARLDDRGKVTTGQAAAAEIEQSFAPVLAARPPRPQSFLLYFQDDSEELTAESARAIDAVLTAITSWPAPEVAIVGHTDSTGEASYNDALALRRASAVSTLLESRFTASGVAAGKVSVAGRGEREPLVPTADEVEEPRNRRVEIVVR